MDVGMWVGMCVDVRGVAHVESLESTGKFDWTFNYTYNAGL